MASRQLTILHFNDVYNIDVSSKQEPVGGAARFVHAVKQQKQAIQQETGHEPLVLFSGDCFNPSLMSVSTLGKQMVPVLNALGLAAACVGNHDFDWGLNSFVHLSKECNFPWLMANVQDVHTGKPLGGVGRTLMLQHPSGICIGLMGIVEGDWVETLSTIEPEDVKYTDFVTSGRELAAELRASGADLVIALTHMRQPNDILLAQQVPEIDVVLGGHDHFYNVEVLQPHGNLLAKSGTDFKELSRIEITLPGSSNSSTAAAAENTDGNSSTSSRQRPSFKTQRIEITSDIPEDPEIAEVVSEHSAALGSRMDVVLGASLTELDGRFTTVRTAESNLCNLLCDVFRRACSADVVVMNSGTFRSDAVHAAGPLTYRDLVTILPMIDDTVVLCVTGQQLLEALENGVSMWPKQEGRFPQVSGVRFSFDPSKPAGSRIAADSVSTGSDHLPLVLDKSYALATKAYLAEGKDGYDVLEGCKVLMDAEVCPSLLTAMRNYFNMLEVLNTMNNSKQTVVHFARRWAQAVKQKHTAPSQLIIKAGNCVQDPLTGQYVVSPVLDGRITRIGGDEAAAVAAPAGATALTTG